MDPVSLIVAALAAGAANALKDTATEAVKDAYSGLKSLLKRRLGDRPAAEVALDRHETAPEVWQKPLEQELAEAGVADDAQLVELAQKLLAMVDPGGTQAGKYNVTISGGQGTVVGDHNTVQQTFGNGG